MKNTLSTNDSRDLLYTLSKSFNFQRFGFGSLYITHTEQKGVYKIGISEDFERRRTQLPEGLNKGEPYLVQMGLLRYKELEKELHKRFAPTQTRLLNSTETFLLSTDDLKEAKLVIKGYTDHQLEFNSTSKNVYSKFYDYCKDIIKDVFNVSKEFHKILTGDCGGSFDWFMINFVFLASDEYKLPKKIDINIPFSSTNNKEKIKFGTKIKTELLSKLKIQAFKEGKTVSSLLCEILDKHYLI